jgi:hypothetical protein
MNIFVLDKDPKKAAKSQVDKHIVKMPLETAQLLCSSLLLNGVKNTPYKLTHKNHPCTIWSKSSRTNFQWLVKHGIALSEEYTSRYGKRHKSQDVIEWCSERCSNIPDEKRTPHAQAMPEQYKNTCAVTAYRNYYLGEKSYIATWKQNKPVWWNK